VPLSPSFAAVRSPRSALAALLVTSLVACANREERGAGAVTATGSPPGLAPAPSGDPCQPPEGTPLALRVLAVWSNEARSGAAGGVQTITSPDELRRIGVLHELPTPGDERSPVASVDLSRERVAVVWAPPGAVVKWVTETTSAVVIGVAVPAQCGGAPRAASPFAVVLPPSSKPVRYQGCVTGSCGAGPLHLRP
jgi:hypothetical protein